MGYKPEEVVGKLHFYELIVPEIREEIRNEIFSAFQAKVPIVSLIIRANRKDGSIVLLETNGVPIENDGRPVGYRGANADITEREEALAKLKRSEGRYRSLYEGMMDAYGRVDTDGLLVESNSAYQAMTGYSQEELSHLTYSDLTPEKWHEMEAKIISAQVAIRGYSDVYQKEYRRKNGEVFPVELRAYQIFDDSGKPIGMWAIVRDITERIRVEKELRQERDRAQKYLDIAGFIFLALDLEGNITMLNQAGCQIIGCTTSPLGKSWFILFRQEHMRR